MESVCPFYTIGDQLCLKLMALSDHDIYQSLYQNKQINKYFPKKMTAESLKKSFNKSVALNQRQSSDKKVMVIKHLATKKIIGLAAIKGCVSPPKCGETGVLILPQWQGQKLGQEVKSLLLKLAFDTLNYTKLNALCHKNNQKIIHINQKIGYKLLCPSEAYPDYYIWQIDKNNYTDYQQKL